MWRSFVRSKDRAHESLPARAREFETRAQSLHLGCHPEMLVSMLMPVGVPNVEYMTPVGCETRIRDVIRKTYSSTGPRCNCTLSLGHTNVFKSFPLFVII